MTKNNRTSLLTSTLAAIFCLCGFTFAIDDEPEKAVVLSKALVQLHPPGAVTNLEMAKEISVLAKSVTVGPLSDRTQATEILRAISANDKIVAVTLESSAIQPEAIVQLRGLKSLRTLTLDRRFYGLGKPEIHEAVSQLRQLTSLQIRYIQLFGA